MVVLNRLFCKIKNVADWLVSYSNKGDEKCDKITACSDTLESRKLSLVMRRPAFCICENKDADQLRGNREADQHLCFRYTDSTIPPISKSEISCL